MTNKTTKNTEQSEQLDFYFWLGEDGELVNVDEEEFQQKQQDWPGARP